MGELSQVSVLKPDGSIVMMESLWHDQPAVLVFLRHFG
jgi:hypothetical protein